MVSVCGCEYEELDTIQERENQYVSDKSWNLDFLWSHHNDKKSGERSGKTEMVNIMLATEEVHKKDTAPEIRCEISRYKRKRQNGPGRELTLPVWNISSLMSTGSFMWYANLGLNSGSKFAMFSVLWCWLASALRVFNSSDSLTCANDTWTWWAYAHLACLE